MGKTFKNLTVEELYEHALRTRGAQKSREQALVFTTGKYTGRVPKAKYIVKEPDTEKKVWWGEINRPFQPVFFENLKTKVLQYTADRNLYLQDCYVGADPNYRLSLRVITENPVHALFAKTMFIPAAGEARPSGRPAAGELSQPDFTLLHAPQWKADPGSDHTAIEAFVILHFEERLILIGGTAYAGEIKKSLFTVMNYLMPEREVLPMHCSANYGKNEEDAAVFFGLSGTGKTTLSAAPGRTLVGDDEHGWSGRGIFNFEGGCYAKVIQLSQEKEPEIYRAAQRYGTLLENVVMNPATGEVDYDNDSITENTRAAYPISFMPSMTLKGTCGHPKNILMLACDAFGILPPVAKLNEAQAMYHFLSGYTAKIAGTEAGIVEPQAAFSPCFGGPFMPRSPKVYADLLGERVRRHQADVWLVNTGWIQGPYGKGKRIPLQATRHIVEAVLSGRLKEAVKRPDPLFGFEIPISCPNVPSSLLFPRESWEDASLYDQKARELTRLFQDNIRQMRLDLDASILKGGPRAV